MKMHLRLLPALVAALFSTGALADDSQTLTIKTLRAQMRYDVTDFTVKPGQQVKIIFQNEDDMPHNLCFFQPGTDVVAAANKQMERPEEALKRNWLPEDSRMWLHSRMLNPGEAQEIGFKAPEKPAVYPYVCTFPGHAAVMQGRMKVAASGPTLAGLQFKLYLGDWKKLPDFTALKPHREGEIADNRVQLKLDDYKNQFGIVFAGKLKAPRESDYVFMLSSDDGARILLDGKQVVETDGIHPAGDPREGKVKLKAGEHDFRLEYFQAAGHAELYAAWRGGGFGITPLSKAVHPKWKEGEKPKKKSETTGMPLVVGKEPVVYRNFIAGAGNRGIAVGYPGGFNIAWSAESCDLALVWRGAFIDAARHWNSRGGGHQPPLGFDVFRPAPEGGLPFAVNPGADGGWPALGQDRPGAEYRWKGYTLDKQRIPTFEYEWKGVKVSDRFDATGDAVAESARLVRTIKLDGAVPDGAMFRVAAGASIKQEGGSFIIENGKLPLDGLEFQNSFKVSAEGATIAGKNLILPARAEITVTYAWLFAHSQHARKK